MKVTVRVPVVLKFVNVQVHCVLAALAVMALAALPSNVAVTPVTAWLVVNVQVTVPLLTTDAGEMLAFTVTLVSVAATVKFLEAVTALPLAPVALKVTVRVPVVLRFVYVQVHFVLSAFAAVMALAVLPFNVAVTPLTV